MARGYLGVVGIACVGLSLSACMAVLATSQDPAHSPPQRDRLLLEPFDNAEILRNLAAHRGLVAHRAVTVSVLDEGAWADRLDASAMRGGFAPVYPFGVAPAGQGTPPNLQALFAKGVAGLYDSRTKAVVIHRKDGGSEWTRAWTLVHEMEHALQDQSSMLPSGARSDDEGLALRAVMEGDAEITTAAFISSRRLSFDHWLARLLPRVRAGSGQQAAFAGVPPFARRQWMFPYADGTLFVGALYRAGGYPLVDRMFEHLPVSTEQILHPAKYLLGELPVGVPVPEAPPGFKTIAEGRMGELRTGALLAPCNDAAIDEGAAGWGGDAYAILGDGTQVAAVLWNTAWDDERSAQRFEERARSRDVCIRTRTGVSPSSPPAIVVRDGDRVSYVLGLPADLGAAAAQGLLRAPLERPTAAPPLGDVHLLPLTDPETFVGKGVLRDGRYVSAPLGLSFSTQRFDVDPTTVGSEMSLEESFGITTVRITVTALITEWTQDLENQLAWDFLGGVESAQLPIGYMGEMTVATGVGPARALRWTQGDGPNAALVLVPVCDGKITIAIFADGGGPGMWDEIQRVGRRLRYDKTSPACRFVSEDSAPARPNVVPVNP